MKLAQLKFGDFEIPTDSSVGAPIDVNSADLTFGSIINSLLPYVFTIAGLAVLLYLIYGGYHMIIAAGDPKGLQEARGKITNALIGFVVLFLAYWIVILLGKVLGMPTWGGFF